MNKKFTVILEEDPETKDLIMPLPDGMCDELGWYMVEVPVGTDAQGKDKTLWALDTVTMEEAKEFSQEHIGEQIVSHRVVSKKEALELCDQDNDYTKSWDKELKMKTFFTTCEEQNGNT